MDLPQKELNDLREVLSTGKVRVLRDKYSKPRRTREPLIRWSEHIWLFPFGAQPAPDIPIQVNKNGLTLWCGEEVALVKVEDTYVVVFEHPTWPEDVITAMYIAVPDGYVPPSY